jgi:hypothetical protein
MSESGNEELYRRALERGRRGQAFSFLSSPSCCLLDLATVAASCRVRARDYLGLQSVQIDQIAGSEGRAHEFDRQFNPLGSAGRDRWLKIAAARRRGRSLPPVALIRVGDLYFVQDGHHRVSVARALGQRTIDATVVAWQLDGPPPWQTPTPAPGRPASFDRIVSQVRHQAAALSSRLLPGLQTLLSGVGPTPEVRSAN